MSTLDMSSRILYSSSDYTHVFCLRKDVTYILSIGHCFLMQIALGMFFKCFPKFPAIIGKDMHNVHVKNSLQIPLFFTSSLRFKSDRLITAVVIYKNVCYFSSSFRKTMDHACPNLAKCVRDPCLHLLAPVFGLC